MNDKEKLQLREDTEIRNLLIHEGIIDDHRVIRCGKWSNKEGYIKPNQYYKPYQTFCNRYECRLCRRKLYSGPHK